VVGGGRGGTLDRNYGSRAQDVYALRITTAKQLARAMEDVVPTDKTFEVAFGDARVSQNYLARYYLRAMEQFAKKQPDPELVPNKEEVINLEHVLPETPGPDWNIDPEAAEAHFRRLGDMVLLQARKNVEIGNKASVPPSVPEAAF
jgi:hypothetical protein